MDFKAKMKPAQCKGKQVMYKLVNKRGVLREAKTLQFG